MRLLSFFRGKNKKVEAQTKSEENNNKVLLAMPIFINRDSLQLDKIIDNLKNFWGLNVTNIKGDNDTSSFDIDGLMIVLANMPIPIPKDELNEVISYTYIWTDASEKLEKQTGHAIVSILGGDKTPVERFTILSKLLCSILKTCENCIAIYKGNERLLLHREHYLAAIDDLKAQRMPIPAWIYIGLKQTPQGIDAYTYGMFNFNKPEIEIVESLLDSSRLYRMILGISSDIIDKDANFLDGDMYNLSESIKLHISLSTGVHVDGLSLKFSL